MGGFELGFRAAGLPISPVGFCEREKLARCVLRKEWPSAITYNSIQEIHDIKRGKDGRPSIDIIFGKLGAGDFVLAGERQRVAPRAGRGDDLTRLIRTLQPLWAILEIERDLLTAGRGTRMQSLLAEIAGWLPSIPPGGWGNTGAIKPRSDDRSSNFGVAYGALWRVLDLQYFSGYKLRNFHWAPHSRERIYVVLRRGEAPSAEVLLDEDDLARLSGAFAAGEQSSEANAGVDADTLPIDENAPIFFVWRAGGFMASPIEARSTLPTISGDNVAVADPITKTVRRLTPEEVELAYTMKSGYTATGLKSTQSAVVPIEIKDAPRYRMLGRDTVPPAIVEWIARRLAPSITN